MDIARRLPSSTERSDGAPDSPQPARISLRQPASTSGFIDGAWWPRSLDLAVELPPLLEVLWREAGEITRISYNIDAWNPAPRRIPIHGRTFHLGGFRTSDPLTVRFTDAWDRERIDVLVIAPTTEPAIAQRALLLASEPDSPYRGAEILAKAGDPVGGSGGPPRTGR